MFDIALKKLVLLDRLQLIKEKEHLYSSATHDYIYQYQVDKFNEIWGRAIRESPFYRMWKKEHCLPFNISSIEDLKSFPVLTRKDVQDNQQLIFSRNARTRSVTTGGSTGVPTKFPTSKRESINSYANHYLARGWWGIKPLDEILFFWGHSHLFGGGLKGRFNQKKREFYDMLINTKRLSAYNMSLCTLETYYGELKKSNPVMILGYTSAIFKLAKYIDERRLDIGNKSNLKGVVVTSETVTVFDIELIERVFNVPCIVEYGMAETGVIAYSKQATANIRLFWDTFIGIQGNSNVLNLTTISDRSFPLINYSTDDIVESTDRVSILTMSKISGRKNDFLRIRLLNGVVESHSELFTHLMKSIDGILNFKILQKKDLSIHIEYVLSKQMDIKNRFFDQLRKEFPSIQEEQFSFKQVQFIPKTIAGKAKWIEVQR